jgi:AcrR family transcriptional regulator
MSDPVKPLSRREARRRDLLETALALFLEHGYVATSVEAIATAAGVAVQTIYNRFGSKSGLLFAAFDLRVAGEQAPVEPRRFLDERARAAPDAAAVLDQLSDWFCEVNGRVAAVFALLRDAAAVDPQIADVVRMRAHRRLDNYVLAATELRRREALAAGLELEDAAALIWSVAHPDVYRTLVLERGWDVPRYRAWIRRALGAALLAAPDQRSGGGGT